MNKASPGTPAWHGRVLDLLDDPVGQAILRYDGLSRDDVVAVMAAAARRLHQSSYAT